MARGGAATRIALGMAGLSTAIFLGVMRQAYAAGPTDTTEQDDRSDRSQDQQDAIDANSGRCTDPTSCGSSAARI